MSDQNPYEKLGVTEDASFDEIQDAKGRLMQQYRGDPKLVETVEAAYDAIIMDRLRMRQEGKIKVPEGIRFPEKLPQAPLNFPQASANPSRAWLQRLFDKPTAGEMVWPAVVFLVLSGLTVLYSDESILPLLVALGFGCSIYLINRKEQQFGRAVLLALAGLLVGVGLGTALGSVLQPQITSIGLTIERLATLVTFLLLWLITSFLR
ncbi:MAG TPA: molecular chaperone DnaJ [Cyanobacteria bacterium UBA9273]|nr:molecular chaperone DnaJ [Cyanobacteria bacterium UBA9273]